MDTQQQKLQVVFLFGQSNMVGLADPMTAAYLTQPAWVPPRDIVMQKPPILERPQLWLHNGKPEIMFCAVAVDKKRTETFNVAIPLKP